MTKRVLGVGKMWRFKVAIGKHIPENKKNALGAARSGEGGCMPPRWGGRGTLANLQSRVRPPQPHLYLFGAISGHFANLAILNIYCRSAYMVISLVLYTPPLFPMPSGGPIVA